jgi:hypothetical protein
MKTKKKTKNTKRNKTQRETKHKEKQNTKRNKTQRETKHKEKQNTKRNKTQYRVLKSCLFTRCPSQPG